MAKRRIRNLTQLGLLSLGGAAASESLAAQFDGTNFLGQYHADGNIFEIRAVGSSVSVTQFDINAHAGSTGILVRSRPGVPGTVQEPGNIGLRIEDIDDAEWPIIQQFSNITGQGKNNITALPAFDVPVVIPPGSKRAFWITTIPYTQQPNLWYNDGVGLESVYASDASIDILEGFTVGTQNGYVGWSEPRRWNGIVHYSIDGTTPSPTTSPSPTDAPVVGATSQPTNQPIPSPTQKPSSAPTADPDNPNKTPTLSPSSYPSLLPTERFVSLPPTVATTKSPSATHSPSTRTPSIAVDPEPRNITLKPTKAPSSSAGGRYKSGILCAAAFAVGLWLVSI